MYPFFESIRLENQKLHFMQEHEARFIRTQHDNWGQVIYHDLETLLRSHAAFPRGNGKYKCRVVYSINSIHLQFLPYLPREIRRLKTVSADTIDYRYKSTDRSVFEELTHDLASEMEILIFKNGFLTDSSFSNVALFDGQSWYTPATPLLEGVHRSFLLSRALIQKGDIKEKNLKNFEKIRLINVMMDWENTWELDASSIT